MLRQDFQTGLIIGAACGAVLAIVLMVIVDRVRGFIENRRYRRNRPVPVPLPAPALEHPAIAAIRKEMDDSQARCEQGARVRAEAAPSRDEVIMLTQRKGSAP